MNQVKTKPKIYKGLPYLWLVNFGHASYAFPNFEEACIKARWLWWHQPKMDLE